MSGGCADRGASGRKSSGIADGPAKEDPPRPAKTKTVKLDVGGGDSSTPSTSPAPTTPSASKRLKTSHSTSSPAAQIIIDLPMKTESETEITSRLIQVDLNPESPTLDHQYDSASEALTPPPKKM